MLLLILGLLLFLGVHSVVIFLPNFRATYRQRHLLLWKVVYGALSIAGFVLIILGYAQTQPAVMHPANPTLSIMNKIIMLPVFILFFAPYLPGKITQTIRHPQLLSVVLFTIAHLLISQTAADFILFGAFLLWAILDIIALNRLPTTNPPNKALRLHKLSTINDIILIVLGLSVYIAFVYYLHAVLIGVPLK